ncbi:hypothetical protein BGW41_000723 [Actinomortierella wolfii]|nr:hypothetical protein BGW41_000723 [Actinomortierella wolfii]
MPDTKEVYDFPDEEKQKSRKSVASTLSTNDSNEKLKAIGETNPYYIHDLTWTEEEERRLVRTFDLKILSWIGVMFFFLQLDRGNMSNALTDNIMADLGVDINTMTLGTTVFVIFFVAFEIPSNMVIRRIGAHRWIPFLMTLWGLATAFQVLLHDKASFLICRAFVGMFEAGYIPGIAIYLTTYYKRAEMAFRLSIFWSTLAIANSVAGILAYGILHMRGIAGLAGWKWLFLIEGVGTVIVGLLSFFILPEGPTATKGFLRFNGYLTERQEQIAVTRLIRDDPSKAENGKKVVPKKDVFKALLGPRVWAAWIAGNTAPVGKRTIALAMYIMSVNLAAIPGANIFRAKWAPRFIPGMWILFGSLVITALLFVFQRFHLAWHNKRREEITKNWTAADWEQYNNTTTDYGDSRLDFRYTY